MIDAGQAPAPPALPLVDPGQGPAAPAVARFTNQTVLGIRYWTPELLSFRTSRAADFRFTPGHYARLGLPDGRGNMVWRPFSVVSARHDPALEFLAVLVPGGEFSGPLSNAREGDAVCVGTSSYGFMNLDGLAPGSDLWLLASGTGIGPFLSILRDAATWQSFDNIVLVHSVRRAAELTYRDEIAMLLADNPPVAPQMRLRYLPVVTREASPGALSARIPQLIDDGRLQSAAGLQLDLQRSRIMVCGNPEMNRELRAQFSSLGFRTSRRGAPGQLVFENYW